MNEAPCFETRIHFLVALRCEAKALIEHYRLAQLTNERAFAIYRNESMSLTVTGVGKTAMAAALAYRYARLADPQTCAWLNIGVAGHPDFRVGEAFLAHKVTDRESARSWYPPIIAKPPCRTECLITGSRPETRYETRALYDMEASAFFETACRFSCAERVQCFKVVSDNRCSPADFLDADRVTELIENRIALIDILVDQQRQLPITARAPHTEQIESFTRRWHFSVQQTLQLDSLLHRFMLLNPDQCPDPEQLDHLKSASRVLADLREKVARLPVVFA